MNKKKAQYVKKAVKEDIFLLYETDKGDLEKGVVLEIDPIRATKIYGVATREIARAVYDASAILRKAINKYENAGLSSADSWESVLNEVWSFVF